MQNNFHTTGTDTLNTFYTEEDFVALKKFDVHTHVNTHNPAMIELAKKYNFGLLSINVDVPGYPALEKQQDFTTDHLQKNKGHFGYITSFRINNLDVPGWLEQTIRYLSHSFNRGALGVKVWKNIGMEYRYNNNAFVMIDDVKLDPVFEFIEKNNKTLLGHLGEPRNCWLPLAEMTVANDREYFEQHPEYHMYLHPEFPSYEDQIAARDHMLKKHPGMRFVGAHLASLEWSTDEIAKRLEAFPNMAVDMAERISHLQYQTVHEYEKVRDFFLKYQNRLLYSTDLSLDDSMDILAFLHNAGTTWKKHWKFFTSNEMMEAPEVKKPFRGLHLPKAVINKLYLTNAANWYPGLI